MKIEEVFARRRFIMLDGAMGTQLQLRGLTTEQKPELAAFIMPDVLTAVHRDYARAGADILLANTFGANPRKLKGTGYTVQQVIEASIACARTAAQETGALVALDIGPIGELLAPAGFLRIHKSYLVNYRAIARIQKDHVLLTDGQRLPLSKHRYQDVISRFMACHRRDSGFLDF